MTKAFLPRELAEVLEEAGAHVFTADMLENCCRSLEELDRLPGEFVVFMEPPSLDARIVNQFALFSLMSSPTAPMDDWLQRHATTYRRIIPASLKWEVRASSTRPTSRSESFFRAWTASAPG